MTDVVDVYDLRNPTVCPDGYSANSPWFVTTHCDYPYIALYVLYGLSISIQLFFAVKSLIVLRLLCVKGNKEIRSGLTWKLLLAETVSIILMEVIKATNSALRIVGLQFGKSWIMFATKMMLDMCMFGSVVFDNRIFYAFSIMPLSLRASSVADVGRSGILERLIYAFIVFIFLVTNGISAASTWLYLEATEDIYNTYKAVTLASYLISLSQVCVWLIGIMIVLFTFRRKLGPLLSKVSKTLKTNKEVARKTESLIDTMDKHIKKHVAVCAFFVLLVIVFTCVPFLLDRLEYFMWFGWLVATIGSSQKLSLCVQLWKNKIGKSSESKSKSSANASPSLVRTPTGKSQPFASEGSSDETPSIEMGSAAATGTSIALPPQPYTSESVSDENTSINSGSAPQ